MAVATQERHCMWFTCHKKADKGRIPTKAILEKERQAYLEPDVTRTKEEKPRP